MSGNRTSPPHGHTANDVKKWQDMLQKGLQSPTVKFLRGQLEKAGCPVRDNFFRTVYCPPNHAYSGGYIPGQGIIVCGNLVKKQDEVTQALIHELIHAFDDCRSSNLKWENCAHQACSEIRANHLSGDCHYKREVLRGFLKIRGHEPECVRRRALKSLATNPYCYGSVAKDSVEAVWDVCYNDTKPFDKAF